MDFITEENFIEKIRLENLFDLATNQHILLYCVS